MFFCFTESAVVQRSVNYVLNRATRRDLIEEDVAARMKIPKMNNPQSLAQQSPQEYPMQHPRIILKKKQNKTCCHTMFPWHFALAISLIEPKSLFI